MWGIKILIYSVIFYVAISIISKIVEKRKVKKYGKDITIDGTDRNDSGSNSRTGDAGTDKQQSGDNR